jgi:hypothetical protein
MYALQKAYPGSATANVPDFRHLLSPSQVQTHSSMCMFLHSFLSHKNRNDLSRSFAEIEGIIIIIIMCTNVATKKKAKLPWAVAMAQMTLNMLDNSMQEKETAYKEAWDRAPRLLVAESNPAWFLK